MKRAKTATSSVRLSLPASELKLWRVYVTLSNESYKEALLKAIEHFSSSVESQALIPAEPIESMQVGIQGATHTHLKALSAKLCVRTSEAASLAVQSYLKRLQDEEHVLFAHLQQL